MKNSLIILFQRKWYLIHCSSGPNGSSILAPLNFEINACIPPVTPPPPELLPLPELLVCLFLDGCDKDDKLIGDGLAWRKGDVWRATSPWSSFDPGTFLRCPLIASVVALLLKLPFDGESGLLWRIFFARIYNWLNIIFFEARENWELYFVSILTNSMHKWCTL